MRRLLWLLLLILLPLAEGGFVAEYPPAPPKPIVWQKWDDTIFQRARREHKFVLLDLHAVWCHWCHVMDERTYADPRVMSWIKSNYIAVGVDQDSRHELA
jgi:uncharacterized protein